MWWGLIIQDFVSKAKDLKLNSGGNKKKPIYYIYTGMSLFKTIKLLFDVLGSPKWSVPEVGTPL